jgi:transcriptional regulator with XRE-family HTH domain
MNDRAKITGRMIAAARALTGISRADLAEASGVPIAKLAQIEAGGRALLQAAEEAEALRLSLENFGVLFIPEGDGMGAGVRLKFLRQDVKQISRLEGEGGMVKEDDVP